ncbi:MAG: VWA domain-containing protein, partial [Planctomycetaceae bacterium]|nr:VWA domain-containing protein [Planctomycetaceae bacterium]
MKLRGRTSSSILQELPAWGISLFVNLLVLLSLNFIVREVRSEPEQVAISSIMEELHEPEYQFSATITDQVGTGGSVGGSGGGGAGVGDASVAQVATSAVAGVASVRTASPQQRLEQTLSPTPAPFEMALALPNQSDLTAIAEGSAPVTEDLSQGSGGGGRGRRGGGGGGGDGGVAGAMDRLTFEIAASLKERQTLVIWLFDSSQSLDARRAAIADRFENVYNQLEQLGATSTTSEDGDKTSKSINGLFTAVASYQDQTQLITPQPVESIQDVVTAVEGIQPDKTTPKENVFSAVRLVIDKWDTFRRSQGRWNKLIFIITDEKGENEDAVANLEEAITVAKRHQFRIYVAGNAAIFGQERNTIPWTYDDGYVGMATVDQGPESAFPMLLQLPFWGSGQLRLSSGCGPYALSRLTAETGGMYLITEDTASVRFNPARMREYMPEYDPIRVLETQITQNPAMAALVETSRQTYLDSIPLPTLVFNAENDNQLRTELTEGQRGMVETEYWVDRMWKMLQQGVEARKSLGSARWKASFDLAMGRLLAMRVRLKGYNVMLAQMKSNPRAFQTPGSNEWRLVASQEIDTGPEFRSKADESRTLLKGVIDEHPNTPWEQLAARELQQDMGWKWEEGIHYVEGLENRTDVDQEVVRLLLAEEERRMEQRQLSEKP